MSKEKQIEEKHELSESIYMSGYGLLRQDCDDIAEQLCQEGYRKQSEGEWILHTNFNGNLNHYECSVCHKPQGYLSNYCEDCGSKMKGGAK